jgi:acyl-CoA synthetase (AMP-forming)/AMP-acid ligase II/thioesterase domain-containing protein/acyl carrier protein
LYLQVQAVVQTLNGMGLGRPDRVAVVLPNGPEMAAAFLGVAAGASCAPLNPGYTPKEFEYYLGDLQARAVVVPQAANSAARTVAEQQGLHVIELRADPQAPSGTFTLEGVTGLPAVAAGFARADDVALLLHTSGTTSRPKLVPLTQANLCNSAQSISHSLLLNPADRCLNVMPLFHIHGLMGALWATLMSGGAVMCPSGSLTTDALDWIEEFQPTWFTAVPTIHQTILAMTERSRRFLDRSSSLRFIRSCSAALPPKVMADLERALAVPVIEAYGMTEAAHQMASNPLPPGERKPGTVGIAAGSEIAIMDEFGALLPPGSKGEVVVRGANVMHGYENNPTANAAAFCDGWFRTGDQGIVDQDGYLTITGRLKEIINRGGEKISPREVEDILLDHPAVAQAVAFAAPHATLGEDVAAAVVLRQGSDSSGEQIRDFVATRLVPFKVPRRVIVVTDIPKGATGKLQRIGLATRLGLGSEDAKVFTPPRDETERTLARLWQQVLGIDQPIGLRDDFFDIGGNSLQAGRLFVDIEAAFGAKLPLTVLFRGSTLEALATAVREHGSSPPVESLVTVNGQGARPPVFFAHEAAGEVFSLAGLSRYLGQDQPVFGFQARGLDGKELPHSRIEDMAAHYIQLMRRVQAEGPYFLGGHSYGGVVAFEMARQLHAAGHRVGILALIDTPAPLRRSILRKAAFHAGHLRRFPSYLIPHLRLHGLLAVRRLVWKAREKAHRPAAVRPSASQQLATALSVARSRYVGQPYHGQATLFRAVGAVLIPWGWEADEADRGWRRLILGGLEIHEIPGPHGWSLSEPHVQVVAERLRQCLTRAQSLSKQGLLTDRDCAGSSQDGN